MGDKRNYILGTQYGTKGSDFNKIEQFSLGVASGGLKIAEAILELGAGFIDYATDSNLLKYLEENFPKVNVDDGVGKFTELLVQYGVPYIGATKIASRLVGLKKLDSITKSTGASGVAKRMGYYGAIGAVTEPIITTSRDKTLGQTFGLTANPNISDMTGRARAAATFKQKGMMGLEAAGVGAALPVAGVAAKGALIGATKVAKPAVQVLDFAVVNPLSNVLAKGTVGENITKPVFEGITKAVSKAREVTANTIGLKSIDEIRLTRDPENFVERIQKKIINNFTTSGQLPKNAFDVKEIQQNAFRAKTKELHDVAKGIDDAIENLVRKDPNAMTKADTIPHKEALYKDIGEVLNNNRKLSSLPDDLAKPVSALKKEYSKLKTEITNLMISKEVLNPTALKILKNSKTAESRVENLVEESLQNYLQKGLHQSYAVFNQGRAFKINDKTRVKAAVDYVEDFLKKNSKVKLTAEGLRAQARQQVKSLMNQAQNSGSASYFFDEVLPNALIKSSKRPSGTIKFITEDMAKNRNLPKAIEDLLGKGGVKESIFDTNVVLAELLAKKRFINEVFTFNKNTTTPGTKFAFTPDYAKIAREQSAALGKTIRATSAQKDLLKATGDSSAVRGIIEQDLQSQFKVQYPNVVPPRFKSMGDEFKRAGMSEDPFGLYKRMVDHFVPENIHDALIGEVKGWSVALDSVPLYKSFLGFKGMTQAGKTVFSPTTQVRNFTSAGFFALHNGHIGRPFGKTEHTFADIIRSHIDEVFPSGQITKTEAKKVLAEQRNRAVELGVTQSNIMGREIDDLLSEMVTGKSRFSGTAALFQKLTDSPVFKKSQELYMKGDDIWKDYGWKFTQSQLREALPEGKNFRGSVEKLYAELFGKKFNFINGDSSIKTSKEVYEEIAAQYVKNTYPNYNYVPQFVKDLRRLPLGNFISFPAEILRTSANLMKFGAKEMASSNPVIRKMGAKRLVGQTIGFSSGGVLAATSMSALGMTRDQYDRFKETQVPEWNRYGDLIMISRKEEDNGNIKYRYIPYSYQNPYAYLQAPFYAFMGENAAGKKVGRDWDDRFLRGAFTAIGTTLQPFMDEAILTERLLDVTTRGGKPMRGRRLWLDNPDTALGDKMYAGFGHLLEGMQPGVFTSGARITQAVAKERTAYGKQYELGDEALALFAGIRVYDADLANNLNFKYQEFAGINRQNTSFFKSNFFAENATAGTRISSYKDYLENSYKAYTNFEKLTDDLKALGLSNSYINKELKSRKASKNIRASIRQGRFMPPDYKNLFNDDRFIKLSKSLGISRAELFPRAELRELYNDYRFKDLLQSIGTVRSQIQQENAPVETAPQAAVQGQRTTVSPLPIVPSAPKINQQVAGLASGVSRPKTVRQRLVEGDDLLKDFA